MKTLNPITYESMRARKKITVYLLILVFTLVLRLDCTADINTTDNTIALDNMDNRQMKWLVKKNQELILGYGLLMIGMGISLEPFFRGTGEFGMPTLVSGGLGLYYIIYSSLNPNVYLGRLQCGKDGKIYFKRPESINYAEITNGALNCMIGLSILTTPFLVNTIVYEYYDWDLIDYSFFLVGGGIIFYSGARMLIDGIKNNSMPISRGEIYGKKYGPRFNVVVYPGYMGFKLSKSL